MFEYIGRTVGNYHLLRGLGQGGFADVYLGEHLHLGTYAAIKILHTRLANDAITQFRTEARTVAQLRHPNIVRILDFGIEQGAPFLVMDYAPDASLRERHRYGERVSLSAVLAYVGQIADALQFAHDRKVIHRDIKPENMLVGSRQEILLTDFGIAVVAHSTNSAKTENFAGTPYYIAPEQAMSHPRPASDQYALAVVAYEWLAGRRPFDGTFTEIVAKHLSAPPPPMGSQVPNAVAHVLMKALAKDPQQRFSCVAEFAVALREATVATYPLISVALQRSTVADASTVVHISAQMKTERASDGLMQQQQLVLPATPAPKAEKPLPTPAYTEEKTRMASHKKTRLWKLFRALLWVVLGACLALLLYASRNNSGSMTGVEITVVLAMLPLYIMLTGILFGWWLGPLLLLLPSLAFLPLGAYIDGRFLIGLIVVAMFCSCLTGFLASRKGRPHFKRAWIGISILFLLCSLPPTCILYPPSGPENLLIVVLVGVLLPIVLALLPAALITWNRSKRETAAQKEKMASA